MLVSWNWLKELVDLSLDVQTVADRLTVTGNEIESITRPCGDLSGAIVAVVSSLYPHNSQSLSVAELDTGSGIRVCVTAATNLKEGDMVPYGPPGSVLADGSVLGERDFDGVISQGMMLSAQELGVPDIADEYGILRLPEDAPVGADVASYLKLDDRVLELSVTPNRGDMLSMRGIAREVAALFPEASLRDRDEPVSLGQPKWPVDFNGIYLEDDGCPVYALGMADKVKIGSSPLWARIRLALSGLRPVNNVVDATNMVMLALGQPLHAFDADRLPSPCISVRSAREGETFTTLDHKERALTSSDLVICSGQTSVALAGVMGGLNSEIEDGTSRIFLESASFDAARVGTTSRRLGIPSEASYRYARGVDVELPERALCMVMSLLSSWGCASVAPGAVVARRGGRDPISVTLTERKLHRIAMWSDMDQASSILDRLGMGLVSQKDGEMTFSVPSYRPDISIEEDLIEEITRIRGYDSIPSRIPGCDHGRGQIGPVSSSMRDLRCQAISRGYVEIVSYSFHSPRYRDILRLSDDPRGDMIPLKNPLSGELSMMRSTMVPGFIESLQRTLKSGWRSSVRLFEIGKVFSPDGSSTYERDRVAGMVYPGRDRRSPYGPGSFDDLLSVKADVEALALQRGRSFQFVQAREPFGHLGQTAHIVYDGAVVGFLSRLKPSVEKELDLEGPVYCFEFDLAPLVGEGNLSFSISSSYPPVYRDISLLAPMNTSVRQVMDGIREIAGPLLDSVALFDVYIGKGVPEGKRSLAFSMSYRSSEKTLQDEEVDGLHRQVRAGLESIGYVLR
ncbi:phenylalanine--tRNA ligase subunit beta [Dethiosulfovibrio salsuginis]|uniref:Phenylalanine--tRNA ligase beta subunit n=1 Tax=Dethiosulfovibrio salsuginis TaxID=561720 RepID=A0A1X7KHC1_9BACT|nr:phenylalanine--tRNA ligase subunit beta [Dethiosulfovibrio salsuginis]SMG40596.1 phenylalanyl-tRNA synthetase beta subunit [Dethiosulfovibrio salsuginis]